VAKTAKIAMTIKSSIKVKPFFELILFRIVYLLSLFIKSTFLNIISSTPPAIIKLWITAIVVCEA